MAVKDAKSTIFVEGEAREVDAGQNLLHACLGLGLDLPYFCWHPALGSVGACRQCAVKQYRDEKDTRGKLVMACMTSATPGTRISLIDPEAEEFRSEVIEWLMVNHPHDCPVCDEGGECHLQDMTVMSGHVRRRYRFPKRTHRNQDLGPFIHHEMNRCIACYRCVRYYRDVAGGDDLDVFGAHDSVYFGRSEDGTLESPFAGNLVEVCPTGVFTDKTLRRHYTRKWDLQSAPSVCAHCAVGCNTLAGEREGTLRRILNRYHHEVNGYFLCDRGRFGYESVNDARRLRAPVERTDGGLEPRASAAAVERAGVLLAAGRRVLGIGSPRASLESNEALRRLVGADRFHLGVADGEGELLRLAVELLRGGPYRIPSLREVEASDAVLVLGEDPTRTAPRLGLALRQAARRGPLDSELARGDLPAWHDAAVRERLGTATGPFFVATVRPTELDDLATALLRAVPDDQARFAAEVASALDSSAPGTAGLARQVADALRAARRPLIVADLGAGSAALLRAAADLAAALGRARDGGTDREPVGLCLSFAEANSVGVALLGGRPLGEALAAGAGGEVDAVVVLENDLYRRAPRAAVDALFAAVPVVVLDHLRTPTVERAALGLPAAPFAEGDGTFVSAEGRAQRLVQAYPPQGDVREAWRWLAAVAAAAGRSGPPAWARWEDAVRDLAAADPVFAPLCHLVPAPLALPGLRAPRSPIRLSGRTAVQARRTVHEQPPPPDPDSPMSFSMEGMPGAAPPSLVAFYRAPGWNSVQAVARYQQEVGGPLRGGDPGVRLFEPGDGNGNGRRPVPVPSAWSPREGAWLVVPRHETFGGEELSSFAPAVAARAASPRILVAAEDAASAGLADGDELVLEVGENGRGAVVRLPVELSAGLPRGVVAVPVGIPGADFVELPSWGRRAT